MIRKSTVLGSRASWLVAGMLVLAVLGACGRKNPPTLPEGQTDTYPQQYPTSTAPQEGVFN